ncbi:hypothetical protein D3C76_1735030 [compost metagenome]
MKDPNDKSTIDGFADLELPEMPAAKPARAKKSKPVKLKPGPRPKNGVAMTGAERAKAFRDRKRARELAESEGTPEE